MKCRFILRIERVVLSFMVGKKRLEDNNDIRLHQKSGKKEGGTRGGELKTFDNFTFFIYIYIKTTFGFLFRVLSNKIAHLTEHLWP